MQFLVNIQWKEKESKPSLSNALTTTQNTLELPIQQQKQKSILEEKNIPVLL